MRDIRDMSSIFAALFSGNDIGGGSKQRQWPGRKDPKGSEKISSPRLRGTSMSALVEGEVEPAREGAKQIYIHNQT